MEIFCLCQVHLNCALWSSEVYETQAGALINVELALRRGLTLRCAHCQQTGATSGCNRFRCANTYHFTCALQASCTFFKVNPVGNCPVSLQPAILSQLCCLCIFLSFSSLSGLPLLLLDPAGFQQDGSSL